MDGIDGARSRERFEKRENKRFKRAGFGATEEFVALDREWGLVDRLAGYIPTQLRKPTQLNLLLRDLDAHELALVTVASLIHSALVGREDPEMTIDIGRAVQDLAFERNVLRPEKYSRKVGRAAMEAGYRSKEWSVENEVQVGNTLLDFCLSALPDVFQLVRGSDGVKAVNVPDEKEDEAVAIYERLIGAHPVFAPCTSPPKPWSGWRDRGHNEERERASSTFVTGAAARHKETQKAFTAAFRNGSMKQHLDGMRALESVPYRINKPILDALWKHYPEILEERFHKKQRRLEDKRQKMAAAGASDKAMHWINGQIKAHAKQFKQDKRQLKVDLAEAERLAGVPFYLELRCDFRGRVYPLPYLHYQRGDHIRALFLFDRGEPIGSEQSLRRLKDYAASCWGHGWDKKTLPERRQWCDENWSRLIEPTAKRESKEWFKAENPFLFLAACIELVAAVAGGPNYVTRLPIAFDGLCNGLLHFCALTRQDPIGLMAAGSTATPAVDTYMVVAGRVEAMFGSEERYQHIKPDRSLAKQPTQTFFYGATKIGRSNQIQATLEERDDVSLPSDPSEAAKLYYAIGEDHRKAMEDLFDGAKETMDFLQEIARAMAKHGEPLQWTTPTGFPLINRYQESEFKTVNSTLRGVRVRRKIAVGTKPAAIRAIKSKNAVAANVIHALDAAHMMLSASACKRAIIDIMGIHDGYICSAPQAERLNEIIRQELVRMYDGHDHLTAIRDQALRIARAEKKRPSQMAEALSQHPLAPNKGKRVEAAVGIETPRFPKVPERGSFDLRELLKNVYAFSS